MQDERR